jgi:UPF0042 nucleotide-binding protein
LKGFDQHGCALCDRFIMGGIFLDKSSLYHHLHTVGIAEVIAQCECAQGMQKGQMRKTIQDGDTGHLAAAVDNIENATQHDKSKLYDARLVIVTGLSGAGRTRTLAALEDFGYFCVDNLPPVMIPQIALLVDLDDPKFRRIAVACDIRGGELFDSLIEMADKSSLPYALLYLDCSDDVLIARFKESRRRHPLENSHTSLKKAIEKERKALEPVLESADLVIDTTLLRASELRARIQTDFLTQQVASKLDIIVTSFGFKYGTPSDADLMFDVRFLPNPYYDPDLRPLSGKDEEIQNFVLSRPETQNFIEKWTDLLTSTIPSFISEGKLALSIAIGCTGGRHRSVVLAEETARRLKQAGYRTQAVHRDIMRDGAQNEY